MKEQKIDAIVVTYNRLNLLKECLEALKNQTYALHRIIVIDNASTDGTKDYLSTLRYDSQFLVLRLEKNIGGAGGFSLGMRHGVASRAEWLWLMDDDTIPMPDALQHLVTGAELRSDIGFACSKAVWNDGSIHLMNKPRLVHKKERTRQEGAGENIMCQCSFVSCLIKTDAVLKVGLPYSEFFIWGDDAEYTERIYRAGYTGQYMPESLVYHKSKANYGPSLKTSPANEAWKFYYQRRNNMFRKRLKFKCYPRFILHGLFYWRRTYIHINHRKNDTVDIKRTFRQYALKGCKDGFTFRPHTQYLNECKIPTSLIVSTYNAPAALRQCLYSIAQQTVMPQEIIIADDGSTDETRQLIEQMRPLFTARLIHVWHEDVGFRLAAIRNKAIAQATGEYIIQIDGDIILNRHFIEDHLRFAEPDHFIIGSRSMITEKKTYELLQQDWPVKTGMWMKGLKRRDSALRWPAISHFFFNSRHTIGCNMAFWRKDLLEVNGYDEDFEGWGHEERDLALRLTMTGKQKRKLKYAAIQYHLWHREQSRDNVSRNAEKVNLRRQTGITRVTNGIEKG